MNPGTLEVRASLHESPRAAHIEFTHSTFGGAYVFLNHPSARCRWRVTELDHPRILSTPLTVSADVAGSGGLWKYFCVGAPCNVVDRRM
jgi:hypothetical protein